MNIINLHLSANTQEQEIQLKEVQEFIDNLGDETYIIAGDFNEPDISLNDTIDVAKELEQSNTLTFSLGIERIDYIFTSSDVEPIDYKVLIKKMSNTLSNYCKIKDIIIK